MSENSYKKEIMKGGVYATSYYITTTIILPLSIPLLTIFLGWNYVDTDKWIYLIPISIFLTSTVIHGLVQWNEWKYRTMVEDKIILERIDFDSKMENKGIAIGVGIELANFAKFSIDVEPVNFEVSINHKLPINPLDWKRAHIAPFRSYIFRQARIIIENPPKSGSLKGRVKFTIKYGSSKIKSLKYELQGKQELIFYFDQNGNPYQADYGDYIYE